MMMMISRRMMGRTKQKYPDTHRRNRPDNHVENEDDSPNDEDSLENGVVVVDPIQNRQKSSNNNHNHTTWTLYGIVSLVLLIGTSAATAFLAIGIGSENHDMESQFEEAASDIVDAIQTAWESYVSAASMIHNYCRNRNFSRDDFRGLYEYLLENGLPFQVAEFAPNITNAERPVFEAEAKAFYMEQYPHFNYSGFLGFNTDNSTQLLPRERADFYFPAHYVEPIRSNEPIIGFDLYSSDSRRRTIDTCLKTGKPALTDRLTFEPEQAMGTYEVALMHPGINISVHKGQRWPRDLASIVICIHDILLHSAEKHRKWRHQIYIYDPSDWRNGEPVFLGAADVNPPRPEQTRRTTTSITRSRKLHVAADTAVTPLPEVPMQVALTGSYRAQTIDAADKQWIVIVRQVEGTFEPNHVFVILGGVIIFGASVCLAAWIFKSTKEERSHVQTEKAALILEAAQCTARRERELNDFIAHEVRNPVAAAMAACNFVKSTIYKEQPFPTREALEITREDVGTIDNALVFVNDLLRDMLDMHRASNNQLVVKLAPTDVRHDILEPVDGILYQRGGDMKVYVECPNNLVVNADRLRLKQVLLNLGRNSAKFVEDGFVKLRTEIDPCGMVQLLVEDSGPGIPPEKRDQLFNKYQESLDRLSQGTGIGLFLCRNLVELMGGEIWLDDSYDSGVPGHPGSRFIVNLKQKPIQFDPDSNSCLHVADSPERYVSNRSMDDSTPLSSLELPEKLSVLFIDDDPILRKLFIRTVQKVAPGWWIQEASSGEAALRLLEMENFDVIFCDMYMASVEKSLLGSETVEMMRRNGVTSRICGLSANDKENEFLAAGADCFLFKPFPCERHALEKELFRILNLPQHPEE